MATMQTALRKAGLRSTNERLDQVLRDVIAGAAGDFDRAIELLGMRVCTDAALMWAIVEPRKVELFRPLLAAKAAAARGDKDAVGKGHSAFDTHTGRAPSDSGPGGQVKLDTHLSGASRPVPLHRPPRGGGGSSDAIANLGRTLALQRMTVLGKTFGECTRDELEAVAKKSLRDAKFATLLIPNMQGDPRVKAADCVKPDEAEALWRAAERANT